MKAKIDRSFTIFLSAMIMDFDLAASVMESFFTPEEKEESYQKASVAMLAFKRAFESLLEEDERGTLEDPELSYLYHLKEKKR